MQCVAFSSFGYNLTGSERPKPLSATLRLLGLKKQSGHRLKTFPFSGNLVLTTGLKA